MANRGRRSGIPDCKPFEGFVLTPQAFSTSNLALGPVLHCSGNYSLSKNREKTITNFCIRNIMAKITKYTFFLPGAKYTQKAQMQFYTSTLSFTDSCHS
jgi:hypothetical protein